MLKNENRFIDKIPKKEHFNFQFILTINYMLNNSILNLSLWIYNNNYLYVIRGNNKNESIDSIEFINIKNMINGWISFKPFDYNNSLIITINQNQILIFGGRDKNGKLFLFSFILAPEKNNCL